MTGDYMPEGESHMRRAIELAERGRHRVMPNPLVGCVLVRDGEVVAEGWHDHIGGLHAEQMAIADAEAKGVITQGTTAYVTLEPCNHFGRTPPCTESLLWAGVEKVVIGAMDPNPTVRGDGAIMLMENGVEVTTGLLGEACEEQMGEFIHWCREKRPLVTLKASTDSRGRVDGDPSEPARRFSSTESLEMSHALRADSMAILVGVGTVIRDNPCLTVRGPEINPRSQPLRVVLDPRNRIPEGCRLLSDEEAPTLLVQSSIFDNSSDGAHVSRAVLPGPDIPIPNLLHMLGDMGIQSLLVEGGVETWRRFLSSELVDKARICISSLELPSGGQKFDTDLTEYGMEIYSESNDSGDIIQWWK
ncbi:MAG: riboflavin biosynthesis protein RibD [Marine Group II euryarchaeote MED-G35]|jgi:diaminohydroxyphosphoribosylaminopyrimidine deaminase/5-amino-6-(5-phosphoribosylamino)uracil reductase|nr:MAG: riboflavin biosynthesis protein RibD [Marine Group II euryarchaeote MED-G35]